jgi:NADPH:quinone reductase-like Zn-dependent oxidoreductase
MARVAREQPARYERWRRELWDLFATGVLRPAVHGAFPLEDAAAAHAAVVSRGNRGKVVLVP